MELNANTTKPVKGKPSDTKYPYPIGFAAVIGALELQVASPAVHSSITAGARKTRIDRTLVYESYPKNYAVTGLYENLKFALRYEPIDLGILKAAFIKISKHEIEKWIRSEPTGIYARKLWYLYELLTKNMLDLPDVPPTGYADLLNPKVQLTGKAIQVRRQRVNDNLLGDADYCPMIRRTEVLDNFVAESLDREARSIVEETDPFVLARAISYLYTRETKSSFAIEGETVGKGRSERFMSALENSADFDPNIKENFVELQNKIVDPRFAATDWRDLQNYVSQTMSDYSEQVHFVSPKPEDVPGLMEAWMKFTARLKQTDIDPVCAAAALSFGFVFIHPFEDANGRIHRFLIHHQLAATNFAPLKLVFPVSAVMLRERKAYDNVLEGYSKSILPFIEFTLNDKGEMTLDGETVDLYRYWDATVFAEFLYHCVRETIRSDLQEELGFLVLFDKALRTVMEIVDMPDRRASLLVRLILQNKGVLSKAKRQSEFPQITEDEIAGIEEAIGLISNR